MIGVAKLPSREEHGAGGCRSIGSNVHPSSQSHKMSIGVVVDSVLKVRQKAVSIAKSSKLAACHQTPIHQIYVKRIPDEQYRDPRIDKETNIPGQEKPSWISTKDKPYVLKTLVHENQSSKTPSETKDKHKLNGFSENASNSANRKDQYLKAVNCEITPQGAEEVVPDKIVTEDESAKRSSNTLKMKLLEILGPDTLPDEDKESNDNQDETRKAGLESGIHVNYQKTHSKEVENFTDGTNGNCVETPFEKNVNDAAFKSGLHSDPIETDSETPNETMKRPVTRSFKRRNALPKSSLKKADNGLCHNFRKMKNITAAQTRGKNWSNEPKCTSLLSGVKRAAVKGARIKPRKISFVENNDAKKKATFTKRSRNSLDKTAGLGHKKEDILAGSTLNDRDKTIPEITLPHKGFHQNTSPVKTTSLYGKREHQQHGPENDKENIISELGTHHTSFTYTSTKKDGNSADKSIHTIENEELHKSFTISKNIFKKQENLHSPITKARTPVESSSPQPTQKVDHVRGNPSPPIEEENIFMGVKIRNFGDWQASKPKCNSSKLMNDSSDDAREKEVEFDPAENSPTSLDKSAPEDCSSDSSEDNSLVDERFVGVTKKQTISSPEVNADSTDLFHHRAKRRRCHQATRLDKKSKVSLHQKDSTYEEEDVFCAPSSQDEDDSLSRVVTILSVALKKLESKVKSATKKKSSEILQSTAEGLNLQLQHVKSLIQADLERVTSDGKSKRKHMETMFHEQQEQLKIFHDNFRKGLNQHIQDTIGSIEEMVTDQAELKGSLEKQKTEHKKLLSQVEEAMEGQLNDANKRISNVHKVANEKLQQLKCVMAECLK